MSNYLSQKINQLSRKGDKHTTWTKPTIYELDDVQDVERLNSLADSGEINRVNDPIDEIAEELFEYSSTESMNDGRLRKEFVDDFTSNSDRYGAYVHFPWRESEITRYPTQDDHFNLRTWRNRNLDTRTEQEDLYDKTIAEFGLSVGSNVVLQLAQSAIGSRYVIGDFDKITPAGLNRSRATMRSVGQNKLDWVAQQVSEIDPYIDLQLEHDGIKANAMDRLVSASPDIIIDEVDDLAAKALLRRYAMDYKKPLVMVADIGDRSVLHVERHDSEGKIRPFKGAMSEDDFDDLLDGRLDDSKISKYFVTTAGGIRYASPRLIGSAARIGKELGGLPQRGSTVAMGSAMVNIAVREILLGRKMDTGTYVFSPKKTMGLSNPDGVMGSAKLMGDYLKQQLEEKKKA